MWRALRAAQYIIIMPASCGRAGHVAIEYT